METAPQHFASTKTANATTRDLSDENQVIVDFAS
jgi:hypothetical protein